VYNRNATVLGNSVLYVTDTAQIGYYRPNNLTGIENILDYRMNKIASVASGLVAEYERLSDGYSITYSEGPGIRPDEPERPDMLTNYLVSMFLEPRLALFKKLYVSGGVRFDQSSIYNQVLTPRIGVSYSFYKHILRFSYAEAFRAPKPWDYTDGLGNPSLLPETMNSYEGSFAMHITDELKADFIGYANKLENAITKETVGNYYRWINSGNITTLGCEIMLRYKTRKLKSFINYTFNQSRDEQDNAIPEISKHTANAGITYSFNDYIRINLRSNFVGKRENPTLIIATNSMEVDPYIVFHGALSLTNNKGLTVQLIAKNILDKEYYHPSNRPPDRYRQPQRTSYFCRISLELYNKAKGSYMYDYSYLSGSSMTNVHASTISSILDFAKIADK
jgi:outer membrane cobalamin receptor